ncbi:MAG: nucleoside deaminase [Hyphomicrobiaceae bacterium]|nr:nucleoside deaminase [Hyphomicrobiaceae bacterium]MCC0023353.1 nucleoside deaminase [Hyphomicrobiaceae bacterium]
MNPGRSILTDIQLAGRFLDVIENDILPLTRRGVAKGNKVFGAAILLKSDLSLVIAETNNEIENPLWHGEMHTLKRLYERPRAHVPDAKDCIFLSTHEPCSLCLSAITWAGFDNFYYFFSYEDTRDAFSIPHDLKILDEVFRLEDGDYRHKNAFWEARAVRDLIESASDPEKAGMRKRADRIAAEYDALSAAYQSGKGEHIPLA